MGVDGSGAAGSGGPALAAGRAVWLAEEILPHEPALRRWLRERLTLPGTDADDIVQESYARLAGLDCIAHVREPRAYLFTVARSVVYHHLRRSQVVAFETVAELDGLGAEAPGSDSPERFASSRQQLALAHELLAALPNRCREVFSLRRIEGLSQREVAEKLRISQSTVEKHMIKALRLLMAGVGAGSAASTTAPSLSRPGRVERSHGKR